MENELMVISWLKKCDKPGNAMPWEYDFKQEVFIQKSWSPVFNENPVKRILEKDSGLYGTPSCETEDSMLMQAIYHILWGTYSKNVIREENGNCDADVMNSFWTIFNNFTNSTFSDFFKDASNIYPRSSFPNKGIFSNEDEKSRSLLSAYREYGAEYGNSWGILIVDNYENEFKKLNNENLQKCAVFSHTIGNFTLTPKGFNCVGTSEKNLKHNDKNNTWSEALQNLKTLDWSSGKLLDCKSWNEYCKKFYMDDYKESYSYALDANKQDEFLKKINSAIENRGKFMAKELCEKLNLTNLNFYEKNLKELKKS